MQILKRFIVRIQSKFNKICNSPVPVQSNAGPMLISALWLVKQQICEWTGFWIFWIRKPAASNNIRSEVFFPVAGSRLDLDFVFTEKKLTVCLVDIYLPEIKQESDCLNLFGTGSGLESYSKFAKQDWTRTQEKRSPNTSMKQKRLTDCHILQPGSSPEFLKLSPSPTLVQKV